MSYVIYTALYALILILAFYILNDIESIIWTILILAFFLGLMGFFDNE